MTTTRRDERLAPIEDNLFAFLGTVTSSERFTSRGEPDVLTYTSDVSHPLFNGAVRSRFAAGDARRRTTEVAEDLISHGRPFLWWLTPTTTSADLEAVLVEHGLVNDEDSVGMYVRLDEAALPGNAEVDGVRTEVVRPEDAEVLDLTVATMLAGFDMPAELAEPLRPLLTADAPGVRILNVLGRLDGEPVGAGSLAISAGTVAGLYNIATIEAARGRGVGRAVSAALMRLAVRHGCTESILHASAMGRPVYERLGYEAVCDIRQYVWLPPTD